MPGARPELELWVWVGLYGSTYMAGRFAVIASVVLVSVAGLCVSCASSDKDNGGGAAGGGAGSGDASGGGGGGGSGGRTPSLPRVSMPLLVDAAPRDYPGIHNAVAFHEGFVSGSVPEGDAGFETLAAMGVKTIISVDGAEPEVELASKHGIRYIHLPIGYNGFDEARRLELTRATRDALAQGPVYVHCHHGKHRSAGAAAAVAVSMGWATPEAMVERMKVSGTAPNYKGLYACASNATVVSMGMLEAVPADFPAVSHPKGMVKSMVAIDHAFEHLKAIEKAGWVTPADHPDLVPVAEAGQLADLFRLLISDERTREEGEDLAGRFRKDNEVATALEDLLASVPKGSVPSEAQRVAMSAQFKTIASSCEECHSQYRD